jgi:putative nucleotidyltransferase with HDIG domain
VAYSIESVKEKINESMASLSPTSAKIIQLANNINTHPSELTKVIKLDPIISAKVLKLVNSSYFALSNRISSLEKAVIMLGLNTIKNLALSAAIMTKMDDHKDQYAFDSGNFWKHSLAVGVTARMIAKTRGVSAMDVENYFIAGMLHDLGILVENQIFQEDMPDILHDAGHIGLVPSEEKHLEGLNHCIIGKILAEKWNLSQDVVSVMEKHHSRSLKDGHTDMSLTVFLANSICKNLEVGLVLESIPIKIGPALYETLGVNPGIQEEIKLHLTEEIDKALELLRV